MQEYQWWGSNNEPPEHFKTKKQLSEMGLAPVTPVGFIETQNYTLYLYDVNDTNSVRPKTQPTEKQLNSLQKARIKRQQQAWYRYNGEHEENRIQAVQSAIQILSNTAWELDCIILDTETTGLENAEIIEIAVIDHLGKPLLNTLVKPTTPITEEATRVHGIQNSDVINAPTFKDIYNNLKSVIYDKAIVIYNAKFDIGVINNCCEIYNLPKLKIKAFCLMKLYAQWYGEYSNYWGDYKWQPLPNAGHRALDDCMACLAILKQMAEDSQDIKYPDFSKS